MGKIRNFIVPIPPFREQTEIVHKVESLFRIIEENNFKYEAATADLNGFDRSILSKAFCGDLVPQDPNDEPASILIEHIRQEKARQADKQKAKPKARGRKLKRQKTEQRNIIATLQEAARPMTPEELFAACGFNEDSVDSFYEQLRAAIIAKKVRETRKGAKIEMETLP